MTLLLHQLGHRYQWSIASIAEDNAGDGVIIGPRYMEPSKVANIPYSLRYRSLFDPQFFLPNTAAGKLREYAFFPDILSDGFSTAEWSTDSASECADRCLEFQLSMEFGAVVIPTRFYEGMPSNFITDQESQFVHPFLSSVERLGVDTAVYLQLILTDQMLKDQTYKAEILNWITSFPELSGVYLIVHVHNRTKQISDIDLLIGLLNFISVLKRVGMCIVIGYTNTESLLLLCAEPDAVTMGSYENLRMFSLRAFEDQDGSTTRGPSARIYIPRLLDWVEHQYIGAIARVVSNLDDYIGNDSYRMRMFQPTYNWHFTKPEPYKHYFKSFSDQFHRLQASSGNSPVDRILAECQQALNDFEALRESGIVFPPGSGGEHLANWITAINLWRREEDF